MEKTIILIGFMGAGKTSVGKTLAQKTGLKLLDTDKLIEKQERTTISHIFETQGEEAFRTAETNLLKSLLEKKSIAIISVGGGLPLKEENQTLLKKLGLVVYLRIQPDTVLKRLKGDTTRPLLQGGDVKQKVTALLTYRAPIYQKAAHITIDADHKTLNQIAEEILTQGGTQKNEPISLKRPQPKLPRNPRKRNLRN